MSDGTIVALALVGVGVLVVVTLRQQPRYVPVVNGQPATQGGQINQVFSVITHLLGL